ncbi:MAG: hypothetical protein JJE09_09200, partial [Bacteroidia bacterium]|nr:hypothetical protein [Bacteroidia bacterium]
MKDLTRQKFEEDWRSSLHGAEVEPPASVWSNLEKDLMQVEGDSMRKKVIFYKWLAAASVIIVVFLGGAFYYKATTDNTQITSSTKPINEAPQQN